MSRDVAFQLVGTWFRVVLCVLGEQLVGEHVEALKGPYSDPQGFNAPSSVRLVWGRVKV